MRCYQSYGAISGGIRKKTCTRGAGWYSQRSETFFFLDLRCRVGEELTSYGDRMLQGLTLVHESRGT